MPLHIYTASAGAGKTHTLTREYLRLALSSPDPHYFASIQAVTFTKKATGEMKERIIAELHQLAQDPTQSPFARDLEQAIGLTRGELQARASRALRAMLLDYNAFRVRTIDSFFQEVVRAFARELGQAGTLRVELATDPLLRQAVQEVLASQDEHGASPAVQAWIEQLLQDNLEDGKRFTELESGLTTFGRELEVEAVKLLRAKHLFPTKEAVAELRSTATRIRKDITERVKSQVAEIFALLEGVSVAVTELAHKTGGALSMACRLRDNPQNFYQISGPGKGLLLSEASRVKAYLQEEDPLKGLVGDKATAVRSRLAPIAGELKAKSRDLAGYLRQQEALFQTVTQLLRYVGRYGLLIDIDSQLQRLKQEDGVMFISDAPSLISSLLEEGAGDAPFLYEKIGTRIRHHMIDEFQDTSSLQYTNFKPLLTDALAEGKDCLVVGDAKQSIYRFRNSDSSLLTTQLPQDFAEQAEQHVLEENWRSTPEIISFNNKLYTALPKLLTQLFEEQWQEGSKALAGLAPLKEGLDAFLAQQVKAYDDTVQRYPEQKQGAPAGQVVVHRFHQQKSRAKASEEGEAESEEVDALEQLPYVIIDLQKRGYKPSDIAILVRSKATASLISDILLSFPEEAKEGYSLHFVSEEALAVGEALSVRFLIACLSYIASPDLPIRQAVLQEAFRQLARVQSPVEGAPEELTEATLEELLAVGRRGLYEVAEGLIERFQPYLPPSEGAYIVKLLDQLYAWEQNQAADIAAFLDYWADQGVGERIVGAASEDALQLMTIHKSKGLGFPVVLLPNLSFALDSRTSSYPRASSGKDNILWCPLPDVPEMKPLLASQVERVPLAYSSALRKTFFAQTYYEEQLKYQFDALNLLYVATTRPKQELHLWLPEAEAGAPATPQTMQDLLMRLTATEEVELPWVDIPADDFPRFDCDLRAPETKATEALQPILVKGLEAYALDPRLAVLREGLDYFAEESQRRYGRTMHLILSQIKERSELEGAVAESVRRGYIQPEQAEELTGLLRQILEHSQAGRWFDGTGTVLNEQAIIGGGLATSRRPDRVIIYPEGRVEVVDYKFGQESPRYFAQVRRYMELLRAMGYQDVFGYLCYLQGEGVHIVPVPQHAPSRKRP